MDTPSSNSAACAVRGGEPCRSEQGSVYAPGISAQTAGSKVLFLGMVTMPPGERTRAHVVMRPELDALVT